MDDEHTLRESCRSLLEAEHFKVTVCSKGEEAARRLERESFDIALFDLYMSGVSGTELLGIARRLDRPPLAIVMTGNPSVTSSIHTIRAGAWDYISKPFSATHLKVLIGRAAHAVVVARESRREREQLRTDHGHTREFPLLGRSEAFQRVIDVARRVAATDASVFLTGESGTGKELLARFIHHGSRRSSREFVPVNCAALSESLLESEMFGHVEGAFTGAIRDKMGLLEVANGGTLFLDELTDMPVLVQAKLLRVIQDGVVRRVGSSKDDAVVNVRFISATNQDPAEAIRKDNLRRDLDYRLRVVPIHIPPLRERADDIPLLAEHFLETIWVHYQGPDLPVPALTEDAMDALRRHRWPGNVRELQNVLQHTLVLTDPGTEIDADDLRFGPADRSEEGAWSPEEGIPFDRSYHDAREEWLGVFERRYLGHVVRKANGNLSDAARMAGVDRTTLYRLMEKHGEVRESLMELDDRRRS